MYPPARPSAVWSTIHNSHSQPTTPHCAHRWLHDMHEPIMTRLVSWYDPALLAAPLQCSVFRSSFQLSSVHVSFPCFFCLLVASSSRRPLPQHIREAGWPTTVCTMLDECSMDARQTMDSVGPGSTCPVALLSMVVFLLSYQPTTYCEVSFSNDDSFPPAIIAHRYLSSHSCPGRTR